MKALAAMDLNRTIGCNGKLPWKPIKEDFKWFKRKTQESGKMVMGKTTFQEVGSLPNRFTYVLTNSPELLAVPPFKTYQYISLKDLLALNDDTIFVCGGAQVYQQLLPHCDEVFLTIVLNEYEGDVFMPEFESMFKNSEILWEGKEFWIVRYWK